MAKPAARIIFLEAMLALGGAAIVARSFVVQVVQHGVWQAKLRQWREMDGEIPAQRGRIFDRNGDLLAESQEQYHISISLNEVQDTAALASEVQRRLGVSPSRVNAEFRADYPYFNGPYSAEQVRTLRAMPGVNLEPLYHRVYPMQTLADRILGRLDDKGESGIEGVERALDTLLRGKPGRQHFVLDNRGNRLPAPGPPLQAAVPGHDVYLTLDRGLQGVAEGALREEVARSAAHGGDVVILDVHSGELLAVASLRTDSVSHRIVSTSSALVEPNEPGSTSKLFTVAAILRTGTDTSPVMVDGNEWMQVIGRSTRRITDVDKLSGPVSLGKLVKYSSNIAISKYSLRLRPDAQYETIRDFGFGTYPAIGFPGEAHGKLDRPAQWANEQYSKPSLGMGYEWEATAVQLAVGYGAIANHGVLMQPALWREVRDAHGAVTWRHQPDTVRRAVPDSVARKLMEYLRLVVDSGGTGARAQLDVYKVAGKTGTAKVKAGGYRSSFAGVFSADNPQVVMYVMIDRPTAGDFYGGAVAAPVVASMMKQALALEESPLDRSDLTASVSMGAPVAARHDTAAVVHRVAWPIRAAVSGSMRSAVPSVAGQPVREAVVLLERAGFVVRLVGRATVRSTSPVVGDSLPRGSTVTLYADSLP